MEGIERGMKSQERELEREREDGGHGKGDEEPGEGIGAK